MIFMKNRLLKSPDIAFASLPILSILSIYTYYLASMIVVGFWPTSNNPDPKTKQLLEQIGILYSIPSFLIEFTVFSFFSYLVFLPYRKFYYSEQGLLAKIFFYLSLG